MSGISVINVNKKRENTYEFAKAISHSLCHTSSGGRRLPGVPLEVPAVWGPRELPHLAVLSRFWVTTSLDEPLRSLFQVELYLISGVTFPTSRGRCRSPRGDPVPFDPGGLGCSEDPEPFVSTRVMLHKRRSPRIRLHPHVLCKMDLCRVRYFCRLCLSVTNFVDSVKCYFNEITRVFNSKASIFAGVGLGEFLDADAALALPRSV